jgi:F0F1-type ATP synthase assembly protein I
MTIDWGMILFLVVGFGLGYGVRETMSHRRRMEARRRLHIGL